MRISRLVAGRQATVLPSSSRWSTHPRPAGVVRSRAPSAASTSLMLAFFLWPVATVFQQMVDGPVGTAEILDLIRR